MVNVVMITLEIGGCTDISFMHHLIQRYCGLSRLMAVIAACVSVVGCVPTAVTQQAVTDYQTVASQISIGDAKEYVLSAIYTSQQAIPAQFKKPSEQYLSYGEQVEIHFVRTALTSGVENADDDFTPYVFKNDVLVSVGWTYVSKTDFLDKAKEAISAGGVKQDRNVFGVRR